MESKRRLDRCARARILFELQPLESRVLLAAPLPGSVIDLPDRHALLDNLVLSTSLKNSLRYKLNNNDPANFDQQLLDTMRGRASSGFFFDPGDAATYATYITTNIGDGDAVDRADDVRAHLFPEQSDAQSYTVQLPTDIDWDDTSESSNPEFIHALNRHTFWLDLAQAFRFTGSTTYVDELIDQLSGWSQQFESVDEPSTFSGSDRKGWLLDSSIRVENWVWAYNLVLTSTAWSKEANSLFLYKLNQQAQYLAGAPTYGVADNRTLSHAKGWLYISQTFPEFLGASGWETSARQLLFDAMDGQLYDDGSHVEQSPGYASGVVEDLLEARRLDQVNGDAWPFERASKLAGAINAYYQFLSPDGKRPAIGDTYRTSSVTLFLKANLVQDVDDYPAAKPRGRDVWLFGPDAVNPYIGNTNNPALGDRGKTYSLTDSGNYIMRSGSDADARQVIFDAGPKGGQHGHLDLLNFELFGYGAPLIADPGLVRYDSSSERLWAISTPAHNTVSIDGASHGALEGSTNPGIRVDKWEVTDEYAHVTAHHFGYGYLGGRPVVARSIWYDLDGTMIVVDWGESVESHEFATSFTIPGTSTSSNLPAGRIQSTNAGGNVKIQTLLRPGQEAFKQTNNRITSSNPPPDETDAATRYYVTETGTFAVVANLITTYDGGTPPNATAEFLTEPTVGKKFKIRLFRNGVAKDIYFEPPALQRLGSKATSRGAYSDLAFDADGRLHLTYFDRDTKNLKYTVRSTNGAWSVVETIDSDWLVGYDPSMAIDGNGRVGIAYTHANHGDLRYAFHNGTEWLVETVDAKGSTGHYPSLAFSRNNGPVITYFDKSKGDLRMASSATNGWDLTTIDSGQIGTNDVGRFSHLVLDPTRPDASKWAIAYEDTGGGRYRYAIQGNILGGEQRGGYTFFDIDTTTTKLGGYTYLAFDTADRPTVSFYDSANTALKYAYSSGGTFTGINFVAGFVDKPGAVGYYSNLYYDSKGKANILYFDRSNNMAKRARAVGGWTITSLVPGGREIHIAQSGNTVGYTNLDEAVPSLEVLFL